METVVQARVLIRVEEAVPIVVPVVETLVLVVPVCAPRLVEPIVH